MAPDHRQCRQQPDDCPDKKLVAPSGTLIVINDHRLLPPLPHVRAYRPDYGRHLPEVGKRFSLWSELHTSAEPVPSGGIFPRRDRYGDSYVLLSDPFIPFG
jgi:hypothetical protein